MTYPTKKLGEVCEQIKIEKAPVGNSPYIEIGDIDIATKTINFKDKKSVKGGIFTPVNCVIVSRVRPTRGAVALLDKKFVISSAFTILKPKSNLNLNFLYDYLAYNNKFYEYLGKKQKGTNYPSCREQDILDFEIILPPIEIQQKIVKKIEELFGKIDKAQKLREGAQKDAENLIPAALHKIFEEGKKKGWKEESLNQICVINPSKKEIEKLPDSTKVSFVPMKAVDENCQCITELQERKLSEVIKGFTYFKNNDVLFAKITPCMENGKVALASNLVNGIGFGTTEFHVLRSSKNVIPKWIFQIIRQASFREEARQHMTGSAGQKRVPIGFLESYKILLPPLPEQKKIVAYLDSLSEKAKKLRDLQKQTVEDLKALKNSILDKAFKGELVK